MSWTHPTQHECWPTTALSATCEGAFVAEPVETRTIEEAWDGIRAENPTVFDGSVLHVESFDSASGEIRCRLAGYRHLAVRQVGIETGIRALGVSGLLSHGGRVLLAQRAGSVHLYPGRWELAPSGTATAETGRIDLVECLLTELREEVGVVAPRQAVHPMMLAYDAVTRSYDACYRIELPEAAAVELGSEYATCDWIRLEEARTRRDELIPVSQMMLDGFSG